LEFLKDAGRQNTPSPTPSAWRKPSHRSGPSKSPELRADLHARLADALGAAGLDRIALLASQTPPFWNCENIDDNYRRNSKWTLKNAPT
jgi:hypothetical protein